MSSENLDSGSLDDFPAVLILSYGKVTPTEIAKNICNELDQDVTPTKYALSNIFNYTCHIKTKYYKTNIALIPCSDIETIENQPEILKKLESVIVYFDPTKRSFLEELSSIMQLCKDNNIELGLLITSKLSDLSSEISYEELKIKSAYSFDVITLKNDSADSAEENSKDNYFEIVDALKNNIWSNVNPLHSENEKLSNGTSSGNMEQQLEDFEALLSSVQSLRANAHLSRDEFLNRAEDLAEMLSTIMNESDSD